MVVFSPLKLEKKIRKAELFGNIQCYLKKPPLLWYLADGLNTMWKKCAEFWLHGWTDGWMEGVPWCVKLNLKKIVSLAITGNEFYKFVSIKYGILELVHRNWTKNSTLLAKLIPVFWHFLEIKKSLSGVFQSCLGSV